MLPYLSKTNVCSETFTKWPLTKYVPAATVTAEPIAVASDDWTVNDSWPAIKEPTAPSANKFSPSVNTNCSPVKSGFKYFTNKVIGSSPLASAVPTTVAATPDVAPVIILSLYDDIFDVMSVVLKVPWILTA